MEVVEGFVEFKGFKTWYRRVGKCKAGKLPLLVLHGGPGSAHDYLESLDDLAENGREVIYYDQLGCGKSAIPPNPDMWSTSLWEEEINVIREALELKEVHILGQSWGGMLAMQYVIAGTSGVKSLIVASSPASIKLWGSEAKRLIELLPPEQRDAILLGEATGNYQTEAYREAYKEYYHRHVCHLDPYPEYVQRSMDQEGEVYAIMGGPSEFNVTGKLKGWDITEQLYQIRIPTLITSGDMDEATPVIMQEIYERIPDCKWQLFSGTHMVHVEQRVLYNRVIESFLTEMEEKK